MRYVNFLGASAAVWVATDFTDAQVDLLRSLSLMTGVSFFAIRLRPSLDGVTLECVFDPLAYAVECIANADPALLAEVPHEELSALIEHLEACLEDA